MLHKFYFDIPKMLHNLYLKISKMLHNLPFPARIRKMLNFLNFDIPKMLHHFYFEVAKMLHDLHFPVKRNPVIRASIFIKAIGKSHRRKCQQRQNSKNETLHEKLS